MPLRPNLQSSDIPSLTSYNAASVSSHCFEPANCWQSVGFPGNILETYGDDSGYRAVGQCSWLCTVQGNVLWGTCTQKAGTLVTYCFKMSHQAFMKDW